MAVKNIPLRFYENREKDVEARRILDQECKGISKQNFIIDAILFYGKYKSYPFDEIKGVTDIDIKKMIKEQLDEILEINNGVMPEKINSVIQNSPEKTTGKIERLESSNSSEIEEEAMDFLRDIM